MKYFITLLLPFILIGCNSYHTVESSSIDKAYELCKINGGLKYITTTASRHTNVKAGCNNSATFWITK